METIALVCHIPRVSKPTKAEMLAAIRRSRGSIPRKPGDKPFAKWWAEYKAEEKALEERRFSRRCNLADRP
jgi:hypothetical protein